MRITYKLIWVVLFMYQVCWSSSQNDMASVSVRMLDGRTLLFSSLRAYQDFCRNLQELEGGRYYLSQLPEDADVVVDKYLSQPKNDLEWNQYHEDWNQVNR